MAAIAIKPVREVMKVVEPIIRKAGGTCWLEGGTGAHPRLYVQIGGRSGFTPLSTSPRRMQDAIKYKTSDVKRLLRELAA